MLLFLKVAPMKTAFVTTMPTNGMADSETTGPKNLKRVAAEAEVVHVDLVGEWAV